MNLGFLINNAGINDIVCMEDADDETIERMLEVDLVSPMRLVRGFIPRLRESPYGRIVNIGSIWASVSKPGRGLYSAAKNGLHGLTNALAVELASSGVLVNTVCPGFTATELTRKNNSPEQIAQIEGDIPLGRLAEPEEIARAVVFFGSKENTYITGQKILVDGGFTAKMKVKAAIKEYEVRLEDDLSFLQSFGAIENAFFVVDSKVWDLYGEYFHDIPKNALYLVDAVENRKTIETALDICERMVSMNAKRNAHLVSIGGGITQDLTGFAANVLYRGIAWTFVPTTLLAACDSCIGGKTSLNYKSYKNVTFYPPDTIYICPSFFETLSDSDLKSGLGEVVKFNVMGGERALASLEDSLPRSPGT